MSIFIFLKLIGSLALLMYGMKTAQFENLGELVKNTIFVA